MKRWWSGALASIAVLTCAGAAWAWHLDGHVYCEGTGQPTPDVQIHVERIDGTPFTGYATTDASGYYFIQLLDTPGEYTAEFVATDGDVPVNPASGQVSFLTTDQSFEIHQDWVVQSHHCGAGHCWLTAGGARFSALTGDNVGDYTRLHNWGGNVYPGCSPTAGEGGQWNHIAVELKLHFQGWEIQVLECGNVDGIPPGSDSPETPFNYIDFTGTGTLKGIKGNKVDFGTVYFFAHCEDRNEPGSNGQRDGAFKDRYFLNVYTDPSDPNGTSVLLVDLDGDPSTVDPVTITDGNMQIHITSCDSPLATTGGVASTRMAPAEPDFNAAGPLDRQAWLSLASRNPTSDAATLRFGLPRSSRVSLAVLDVSGRRVREVEGGELPAGPHTAIWDLRDASGQRVSGGIYFVRLRGDDVDLTRSIVVR